MNKLLNDKWLLLTSILSLGAAVVSLLWFNSLPSPFKQIVFASFFFCPAITLLAVAKLAKGASSGFVMGCCVISGMVGTGCWVIHALSKIEALP